MNLEYQCERMAQDKMHGWKKKKEGRPPICTDATDKDF
jgi:hypothetical protein